MRRAKIVCTLGPATATKKRIRELVDAGMDVARLNMSHGTHADHERSYRLVREAADATGHGVGIFADLQGPKIRLDTFAEGQVKLANGATFTITTREVDGDAEICGTTYDGLPGDVKPGDPILIDDGKIRLEVTEVVDDTDVVTKVDRRREGQRPQGDQPARRAGQRARDVGEGHRGPAVRAAPLGRLRRPLLRPLGGRRRGRAPDHARGGRAACP